MNALRTPEELRRDFETRGMSVATWARRHGYSPFGVYDVLLGRTKGLRGESHNIAVALGIKAGSINTNVNR